jgi:hexosaminidase
MQTHTIIPMPVEVTPGAGAFALDAATAIVYDAPASAAVAEHLAGLLRPATGLPLPVQPAADAQPNRIHFTTVADAALGDEGYELTISAVGVDIRAPQPAGHFYAVQTLRQLLPPAVELSTVQPGPWLLPAGTIRDSPRYPWRSAMLDVVRHFFGVADVQRYIDLLALYKFNRLHLHLSDDQGWRIEIKSWPRLAEVGGRTAVGGAAGGYYTQAEYAAIVAYAAARQIVVVPEIDMPSHTNAALAAYAELNCDGVARAPYTGIEVGFSSLCVEQEITYRFVDDVLRELAALTPGPYLHIGGDEAHATPLEDYRRFMARVQELAAHHGKRPVGWEEMAKAPLRRDALLQQWRLTPDAADHALAAAAQGAQVILAPADRTYLDMKYDEHTLLGLTWAGYITVEQSYAWEPATLIPGLDPAAIVGVEAPIWAETLATLADVEYMAFPRLPGIAEIGWSPATGRGWEEYRLRLAAHSARWDALGVNYCRNC